MFLLDVTVSCTVVVAVFLFLENPKTKHCYLGSKNSKTSAKRAIAEVVTAVRSEFQVAVTVIVNRKRHCLRESKLFESGV